MRGRFDVTGAAASRKEPTRWPCASSKNATPGSVREKTWQSPDKNGGALGADNPTYPRLGRLGLDSRPSAAATPASGATCT